MNEKPRNNMPNKKRSLMFVGILILCLLVVVAVSSLSGKNTYISYTEFQNLVYAEKIEEVDIVGGTVRIRKVDGVKADDFPNKMDCYTTILSTSQLEFLYKYNDKLREEIAGTTDEAEIEAKTALIIDIKTSVQTESFMERIMPYISLAVIVIMSIFLFSTFLNSNKGAMSYGRSRARMVISSSFRFSDVAGADEEKAELQEVVEFLRNPKKFTELGAKIPKGVLLVGSPGTGKTLLAKAVAGESNVPFFSISGSDFVEMFVGVGASRVRDLFDQAKKHSPCIVFIDEIDAVGRQRGAGLGGGNDEREQTLNQLLVEMDGFETNEGIIILAATNRADVLDPALLRPGRFDRQIYVNMPDVKGREEIIKIHARNKPIDDEVDFKRLARLTSGFAGADIANLLNEAAILAARDNRTKITMADITEGINKVLMGPQKRSWVVTKEDRRITAIHEGGHAIVAHESEKCDVVQEISIIPRGNAGGYTLTINDKDERHITKEKLLQTLSMMLGGRAAEEIMLKDITTGASNDMQRATQIARKMVTEWGMSSKIGLMSLGNENEVFIGRDYQKQASYSEQIAGQIDEEVKEIIDTAYNRAKAIITKNKNILTSLVELLEKKETIYSEEFDDLFKGKSVEDIIAEIDAKEKTIKEKLTKKPEPKIDNSKSELEKMQRAEAMHIAGIISEQEYQTIKAEFEAKANAQRAEAEKQSAEKVETQTETENKATENDENASNKDENGSNDQDEQK